MWELKELELKQQLLEEPQWRSGCYSYGQYSTQCYNPARSSFEAVYQKRLLMLHKLLLCLKKDKK